MCLRRMISKCIIMGHWLERSRRHHHLLMFGSTLLLILDQRKDVRHCSWMKLFPSDVKLVMWFSEKRKTTKVIVKITFRWESIHVCPLDFSFNLLSIPFCFGGSQWVSTRKNLLLFLTFNMIHDPAWLYWLSSPPSTLPSISWPFLPFLYPLLLLLSFSFSPFFLPYFLFIIFMYLQHSTYFHITHNIDPCFLILLRLSLHSLTLSPSSLLPIFLSLLASFLMSLLL